MVNVEEHIGLVDYCMQRYFKGIVPTNDHYQDCYQVGYMGLVEASHRFKDDAGTAFSSYACGYIIGRIKNFLAHEITPFSISHQTVNRYRAVKDGNYKEQRFTSDGYNILHNMFHPVLLDVPVSDDDPYGSTYSDILGSSEDEYSVLEVRDFLERAKSKYLDKHPTLNKKGVTVPTSIRVLEAYNESILTGNGKLLTDIADDLGTSRQYVHAVVKEYREIMRNEYEG